MSLMSEWEAQNTVESREKDHAMPRFYNKSVVDKEATKKAKGVTKHKDVVYIQIQLPGIRGQGWNGKAEQKHFDRFPGAWQRFQAGQSTEELDGFAISECPVFTPAEKDNLRVLKFVTVESLAEAPDAALKGIGMRDMANRAQHFIEALNGPAAMANKLEGFEARLAVLEEEGKEKDATIKALNKKLKNKKEPADA